VQLFEERAGRPEPFLDRSLEFFCLLARQLRIILYLFESRHLNLKGAGAEGF